MKILPNTLTPFNHGTDKIRISSNKHPGIYQMRPTEIHLKQDGSKTNMPSFAFVMEHPFLPSVYGEVSLEMLNGAFNEIGYEIINK